MTPFYAHYVDHAAGLLASHQDWRNRILHTVGSPVALGCLLLLLARIPLPHLGLLGNSFAFAWVGLLVAVAFCLYFALFDPLAAILVALLLSSLWALCGWQDPLAGVSGPMAIVSLLGGFLVFSLPGLVGHWVFQDPTEPHSASWPSEVAGTLYKILFSPFYFVLFLLLDLGYRKPLRQAIKNKARIFAEEYIQIRQGQFALAHQAVPGRPS
jgi:uncharacterized membrane protein YGL010W